MKFRTSVSYRWSHVSQFLIVFLFYVIFFLPFLISLFLANLSGHHAYCLQTADVFQVVFSLSSKQEPKNTSAPRRLPCLLVQSWTKVLGHFRVYGAFHTGPTPPLTPQTMLDACIENFFSEFQLCIRWGELGELQENLGCTVLRGNQEMIEKYEYCSTVLRTFVQYCRYLGYFIIQVFLLSLSLTG